MKNNLNNNHLQRELGLFPAIILVVANMIGTGIFTTSGFIIKELGDPNVMLLCWLMGGIFALCGALCYGELGAMFPRPGGEYVFLHESFGKCMAFLSGWISLIVGFSAPIAAASVAFAFYFFKAAGLTVGKGTVLSLFGINCITISPVTILAVGIIIVFSLIHYHSLFLGTKVQNWLTLFKIAFIVVFAIAGFWYGKGSIEHFAADFSIKSLFSGKFAISLIFISFAYSGWNAAAYLGGEIKNPSRNIPLSLFGGTLFVMCLYLLLNTVFIYALPATRMSGVLEIGEHAAAALFGATMSKYFAGAIAIGILSAVSAMIVTGPRVYYAMAKDGIFFQKFSLISRLHKTPAYSIFLQALVAVVMVLTSAFDTLLIYIGFTLSLFAMMAVIGVIVLRKKYPSLPRDYKTFGYPVTPLIFIVGNLWIIYYSIRSRFIVSLYGMVTIGIGCVLYGYFSRSTLQDKEGGDEIELVNI